MENRRFSISSLVLLLVLCVVLNGCILDWLVKKKPPVKKIEEIAGLEAGFQMFPTPRDFDGPGTIFRVDKQNVRWKVKVVDVPIHPGNEIYGNRTIGGRDNFDLGLIFATVASGNITHENNCTLDFKITGTQRLETYDAEISPFIPEIRKAINGITPEKGNRYYLIRDVVSAANISYKFDKTTMDKIGGSGKINKLVELNSNLSWNSTDSYQLTENFPKPYYVCYKPWEITFLKDEKKQVRQLQTQAAYEFGGHKALTMKAKSGFDQEPVFKFEPVKEKLAWTEK